MLSINQPPRKKSIWKDSKTTSPELEIFLFNVAISLFRDTSRKASLWKFAKR